jgi:thymidylate synthase
MNKLYLPYSERTPDLQYKEVLRTILTHGEWNKAQAGTSRKTKTYPNIAMRFLVKNGAPLITERTMAPDWKKTTTIWKQAIGEIFAFVNGVRTIEGLESYGCTFWKDWATKKKCEKRGLKEGDLGIGSYGNAFHDFPSADGPVNQFHDVLLQMKEHPHLKTHIVSPWVPPYVYRNSERQQKVVVCPCHGWLHFMIWKDNSLTMVMNQRSGDVPIGVPSNMIQYFALMLAISHVLGLTPREYIHNIGDAHFYDDQEDQVKELLDRETKPFPTLEMIPPPGNDLFKFRHEHFEVKDYYPDSYIKIPVAV